jgi:hypothetical protein
MLDPIVVQRMPVTIARIAKATLWFVSQKLSSRMLYLWCFRAAANNLVDMPIYSISDILTGNIIVGISLEFTNRIKFLATHTTLVDCN